MQQMANDEQKKNIRAERRQPRGGNDQWAAVGLEVTISR